MKPLDGILVIDLSRILSGPYCSMMMADMGAEVIKVEIPGKGDDTREFGPPFVNGESTFFMSINRNKKSLTLNLADKEGKEILRRLIEKGDVVIENFRYGVMDRLGFSYDYIKKINPRAVFCSISGFGHSGPYRERPGYDVMIQGEGGVMSLTGEPGGLPMKVGVSQADITAGLLAYSGILLALISRGKTGEGQHIDISMLDGQVALLTYHAASYFVTGENPPRLGNRHPTIAPYEPVKTGDGKEYIILAVGNDSIWQKFCKLVNRGELITNPMFATNPKRVENHDALLPIVEQILSAKSKREWLALLTDAGIPCGDIKTVKEVCTDPQVLAREMVVDLDHSVAGKIKVTGIPIKMSATPGEVLTPPPTLGQHTDEILSKTLGYSKEKIEELKKNKVV